MKASNNMRVSNMTSNSGNKVANQFLITLREKPESINDLMTSEDLQVIYFQSYDSVIAKKNILTDEITLDKNYWDYSVTTGKYRNQFLNENKAETVKKIKSGEYKLADLNS